MDAVERSAAEKKSVPSVGKKKVGLNRPEPPKPPEAPTEKDIKDTDAMPDLDKFHFMKW